MARLFPFDLFDADAFKREGSKLGLLISSLNEMSLRPPYPWGQWLYAGLLTERGPALAGDVLECGVGRGGMSLLLGAVAQPLGKLVYALDTFEGLPPPKPGHDNSYFLKGDYGAQHELGGLLARFERAIDRHGLAGTVKPIKGLFENSLPQLATGKSYCFVHIDADLFDSVLTALEILYPSIVDGGMIVIDDFFRHAQGPARAVERYFSDNNLSPLLHVAFPYAVLVIKGEPPPKELRRALDGNRYTLDLMKNDEFFQERLEDSCNKAAATRSRIMDNALRFRRLLMQGRDGRSSDIYEYLRCMEDYWDSIDVDPHLRSPLLI